MSLVTDRSLHFVIRMPPTNILHFAWRYLVTDRYWGFVVGGPWSLKVTQEHLQK